MYAFMEKPQSKNGKPRGKSPEQKYMAGKREERIPARLNACMERRTGLPFDDVRIHYNSDRPDTIQALAYTQGNHVYISPGQEHCLPHELGHVIQQKLRAVRANASINGLPINTDERLEREADEMIVPEKPPQEEQAHSSVIQRSKIEEPKSEETNPQNVLKLEVKSDVFKEILERIATPGVISALGRALISGERWGDLTKERDYWVSVNDPYNPDIIISRKIQVDEEDIKRLENEFTTWVKVPDYATGDMFTLAAMLTLPQPYNILITQHGHYDDPDKCPLWQTFQRTLGSGVTIENEENGLVMKHNQRIRVVYQSKTRPDINKIQSPNFATKVVAKNYKEGHREFLRKQWLLPKTGENWTDPSKKDEKGKSWPEIAETIMKWANLDVKGKNVYVVWFRHSGSRGGAHLEHDTSTSAMCQLIGYILENVENSIVILAGDYKERQVTKIKKAYKNNVYDFTEFWIRERNQEMPFTEWVGEDKRLGQSRFFDVLANTAKSFLHIGSRSGNLEQMALIGHSVRYIEEMDSYGGARMVPFNESSTIDYKRVVMPRPLTFKGNLIRITNYILKTDKEIQARFPQIKTIDSSILQKIVKTISMGDPNKWKEELTDQVKDEYAKPMIDFYEVLKDKLIKLFENPEEIEKAYTDEVDQRNLHASIKLALIMNISEDIKNQENLDYEANKGNLIWIVNYILETDKEIQRQFLQINHIPSFILQNIVRVMSWYKPNEWKVELSKLVRDECAGLMINFYGVLKNKLIELVKNLEKIEKAYSDEADQRNLCASIKPALIMSIPADIENQKDLGYEPNKGNLIRIANYILEADEEIKGQFPKINKIDPFILQNIVRVMSWYKPNEWKAELSKLVSDEYAEPMINFCEVLRDKIKKLFENPEEIEKEYTGEVDQQNMVVNIIQQHLIMSISEDIKNQKDLGYEPNKGNLVRIANYILKTDEEIKREFSQINNIDSSILQIIANIISMGDPNKWKAELSNQVKDEYAKPLINFYEILNAKLIELQTPDGDDQRNRYANVLYNDIIRALIMKMSKDIGPRTDLGYEPIEELRKQYRYALSKKDIDALIG